MCLSVVVLVLIFTDYNRSSLQKDNGFAQDFMLTNSGKDREGRKPHAKIFWNGSVVGRSRIDDINLPQVYSLYIKLIFLQMIHVVC